MYTEEAFYLWQGFYSRKAIPLSPRESYWHIAIPLAIPSLAPTLHVVLKKDWEKNQGEVWDLTEKHVKITFWHSWIYISPMNLYPCPLEKLKVSSSFNNFWILFGVINWSLPNKKDFYHMLQQQKRKLFLIIGWTSLIQSVVLETETDSNFKKM